MSCQKRKADKEDRDKTSPSPAKRAFYQDEPSPRKKVSDQSVGKNIRVYSDEEQERILSILETEFDNELQAKEDEIVEIQERILKTQRILQYLCYAVVSDFYSREKTITSVASTRQRRIHPAVKKLLSGKGPPGAPDLPQNVTIPAEGSVASSNSCGTSRSLEAKDNDILSRSESPISFESLPDKEKKVPRYIPPKPKAKSIVGNQSEPVRGGQNKIKTILVVGNVSKWLPPDSRDDAASHKWMVYVRGPKGAPSISSFVSKVRFFLHPSYRPNDVVQVVCPPFQLSRRGWGEFPIRVQVHFSNSLNKPVDIIHNLKLDRTYSGLQALGAETVAEVWIHREEKSLEDISNDELQIIKGEPVESIEGSSLAGNEASLHSTKSESSENQEQDTKNINLSQPSKRSLLSSPSMKRNIVSEVITEESLKINVLPDDKMKSEALESEFDTGHCPLTTGTTSSAAIESQQAKLENPTANMVSSPTKALLPGILTSVMSQVSSSGQQSPSKLLSTNTTGLTPGAQKVQCSPSKPGTHLVKCVDSKGTVRLLQVRADLLPKILKKGAATIPATSPAVPEGAKSILGASGKQLAPHSSAMQVSQVPRIPTQTLIAPVIAQDPSQPPAAQALAQLLQVPSQSSSKVALMSPIKIQGVQGTSPGARPVLRLVRPTGNVTARPLLVASNPANQQFIRLPAAAANGNRPLLVLKDGKLFMMKSALGTAAAKVAVSTPVATSIVSNPASKSQLDHESLKTVTSATSRTCDISLTSGSSIINQSIVNSSPQTLSSDVNKSTDGLVNERVPGSIINCQLPAAVNPSMIHKQRTALAVPPAVRLSSPKPALEGDQMLQTINKSNSLLAQLLPPPQSVLNTASTPKVSVKSGKSLLKPTVSLLKANVGTAVSSSKPVFLPNPLANPVSLLKPPSTISVQTESVSTSKRIILGRTSGSSLITTTSQQALFYRELLMATVRACPKGPKEDVWRAVRWMIKKLPLINSEAIHPEFKILHSYCAPDEDTFCSWNIGKQRACEWLRARTARLLLKDAGWDLGNVWTTKEIVLWARFHGYTPGLSIQENHRPKSPSCYGECENPISSICEYGEMTAVEEWLAAQDKLSSSLSTCSRLLETTPLSEESEEEIVVDVIPTVDSPSKAKIKKELGSTRALDVSEDMSIEESLHPIGQMVNTSLKSIGLHLSSEELVPGVRYPAAQRMLIQAVQSLAEDLVRRACANAWGKDISRRPRNIETANVCSAICHRPEFDIFTCAGLGIKAISDSVISSKESKNS